MLRSQKRNSGVSFNDTLLNFGLCTAKLNSVHYTQKLNSVHYTKKLNSVQYTPKLNSVHVHRI